MRANASSLAVVLVVLAASAVIPQGGVAQAAEIAHQGVVLDAATNTGLAAVVRATTASETTKDVAEARTAADGSFTLALAPGKGWIEVVPSDDAYAPLYQEFDGTSAQSFRFLLKGTKADAVLEGIVTDLVTGRPLAGATVSLDGGYAYATEGSAGSAGEAPASDAPRETTASSTMIAPTPPDRCCAGVSTQTGEDGRYRLVATPGGHSLYVTLAGYRETYEYVELQSGATTTKDVKLEDVPDRDAIVSGVVRDTETGLPVAGAWVNVHNVEWGHGDGATTDAAGAFRVATMPGYTQVSVHSWSRDGGSAVASDGREPAIAIAPGGTSRAYYTWTQTLAAKSGANDLAVRLVPKELPTIALQGYAVDATTQKALADAWVSIQNEDTGEWGQARTGADGSYKILVRPGHLVVAASAEKHFPAATTVVVPEGAATVRLDLVLTPGEPRYGYYGDVAVAEGAATRDAAATDAEYPPGAPASYGGAKTVATTGASSGAPEGGDDAREAATYTGGPGNLGAFDGRAVTTPQTTGDAAGSDPAEKLPQTVVPAPAGLLALGAIALAGWALARRR